MEPVLLFLVLLLTLALSIIFYKTTSKILVIKTSKYPLPLPPGPVGYPIVGCLPEMVKNKPAFRWIHHHMQRLNTEIACFRLGRIHIITITSPELSRKFLKEQDAIFASRPDSMASKLTSNGYLSAALAPAGDQWKKMRRIMKSEVLTPGVHEWLHATRCEEADRLVRYVHNQTTNGDHVNVREAARLYCGGVITKMVFGNMFFGSGMEEREYTDAVFTILYYLYGFAICDYLPILEMFDFDGHRKIISNALVCLRKYHDSQINDRVEMWRNGVRNTNQDILDVLINLKNSKNDPLLSIQEIKAQVNEILLAGIDNPSNAVEWALAEMINQPHLLDLASKELDEVVGRERLVQESDLPRLNYINACVKEALRLHPVAPFNLPHVSTADSIVDGYFIPKGSHVLLSRLGLGRNPRVWNDPLKFQPERHIADHESSKVELIDPELRMLSFSIGRRGCPAIKLGSTMATMLLARLVHGFRWKPPSNKPIIDLVESHNDLFLTKPLIAHATSRLEPQVYHQILCKG